MTDRPLTTDMVADPSMWRLSMEISPATLSVALHCPVEANSLIYREIPLDPAADILHAVEDAVYDNPLILQPFGRTDILIDTRRLTLVPAALDPAYARDIAAAYWPDGNLHPVVEAIKGTDAAAVMVLEADLHSFLRRTFPDARVTHSLAPLISYFALSGRLGNSGKIYARLRPGAVDIIAFGSRGLLMANSFAAPADDDVLYYIMAATERCGLSATDDELMICGDTAMRETLMPRLRQFHSYVIPVIFPSLMFRAGKDALRAPFELMVLPLCD
ncbi:MAG: DUF3822 family protein [Bacteroides sp.]|nr:DUF3822 family protein [Bacteroides sp.]MCM1457308.1 DUF3822 family protein [Lachnoclostridium sp.]